MNEITKTMIPTANEIIHHSFACSEFFFASSLLPCAHALSTLLEYIIAAIPAGRQQRIVVKIEKTI